MREALQFEDYLFRPQGAGLVMREIQVAKKSF